ncbi:MAG TPA: hypothetical protein ENK44_04980 [Caldithrix abyssi]|uniref:2-C-methyl-D-erythritol 2,4-cyclodiphosphate synthase domain-containing protein n=1 Tax=Caldithrix abyssi TaxID=187145 RepID=A0A7V4U0G1_CALAY|nr:hypothetical protein [Caldithrix abyssi]
MRESSRIGIGYRRFRFEPADMRSAQAQNERSEVKTGEQCIALTIADALLGAAALGGVDAHFSSDEDPLTILRQSEKKVYFSGYEIVNIDISFGPHSALDKPAQEVLSDFRRLLFIKSEQINIKFLPVFDQGSSLLECQAVCLLGGKK